LGTEPLNSAPGAEEGSLTSVQGLTVWTLGAPT